MYCKTLYFRCILISRFWNVEIALHFNLAFSHCSTSIYQAFDGQTEFSLVFNFVFLSYSRNSRKFDACEKYVLQYYEQWLTDTRHCPINYPSIMSSPNMWYTDFYACTFNAGRSKTNLHTTFTLKISEQAQNSIPLNHPTNNMYNVCQSRRLRRRQYLKTCFYKTFGTSNCSTAQLKSCWEPIIGLRREQQSNI